MLIGNEPRPYVNRLPGFAGIAFAARRKAVAAPLTGPAALRAALAALGAGCAVSSSCSAWSLMFAAQQPPCVWRVGAGLWEEGTSTSSRYKHHFSHHGSVSSGLSVVKRSTTPGAHQRVAAPLHADRTRLNEPHIPRPESAPTTNGSSRNRVGGNCSIT